MLARFDQVDEQVVEVQRMLGERLVQRGAGLDVAFDRQHQLLHRRLVVAVADDVEALDHRDTRLQHRGELAREQRDVLGGDLLAALEELHFLAHALGEHALAAQVGFDGRLGHREHLALDALALLVGAFPDEGELLSRSYLSHGSVLRVDFALLSLRIIPRCTD